MSLAGTIALSGYPTDERGLVELAVARRVVQQVREFRRGSGRTITGAWVWESERLWACLMSLEDAEEFVREASRLAWHFHPRAQQNLEPFERYGRGILPWLFSFERGGVLCDVPACVLPLLTQLAGQSAFELLLRVDAVARDDARFPGPFAPDGPGDVEPSELSVSAEAAAQALLAFAWANPEPTFSLLYEQAVVQKSERAGQVLLAALADKPTEVFDYITQDWEEDEARTDLEALGASVALTEESVLRVLDSACDDGEAWPVFRAVHPDRAYQALRLVVYRQTEGDGWVTILECLEGSSQESLCLKRYVQTPSRQNLLTRSGNAELFVDGDWEDDAENTVVGPCGDLALSAADLQGFEPRRATASGARDLRFTLLVRAYLEENPGAFWPDEGELRKDLSWDGLELDGFDVLLESTAFEHVVGNASDEFDRAGIDARWRKLPSESLVYQSLARAIVARDASLFEPGESNLSWRLHLDAPQASRRLR